MEAITFYTLSAVTLLSALGVVLLRNVLHSALLLGLCLAGVAGLFASLGADFLFAAQILIYVGGIALLVLFVVLLSGRHSELHLRQVNDYWMGALAVCVALFAGMWRYIVAQAGVLATAKAQPTTARLGAALADYLALPFELVSLILIVALVGAVIFSRPEPEA
jgi:NADH:ubiquinone oxidoreductase subunit 6 (subunit J)